MDFQKWKFYKNLRLQTTIFNICFDILICEIPQIYKIFSTTANYQYLRFMFWSYFDFMILICEILQICKRFSFTANYQYLIFRF